MNTLILFKVYNKVYNKLCVLFYKIKYVIYFNIFLNVLFINYLHYKLWNVLNTKLALALDLSIKLNGCVIIKLIQWLNTNLELVLINSYNYEFLSSLFGRYYEDCPIHDLKYTKKMYLKEFGIEFDDYFELDNNFSVKSGSIAQVYKAKLKNNSANNVANNSANNVAIKVIHPEIEYQLICPFIFVKLYTYLVSNFKCFKKYDIIIDLNSFFCNLKKQINMENEYKNNEYFYNTYNNNIIIIPKPLMKSKNFLIMEFIDGEQFEKMNISEYKKLLIISIINIFIKDTFINGKYIHCDLHQANWKIYKQINNNQTNFDYKIIIYDFGYVIENTLNDSLKNICYYLDTNNIVELGDLLFKNISNIKDDVSNSMFKEDFMAKFKKHTINCYPYSDELITTIINFCYINNYKLNNNLLDYFISVILLNKHFKKYLFLNKCKTGFNEDSYYKHIYNKSLFYISICEKYNVFHEIKNLIYTTYINNQLFSRKKIYTNNFFDNLKKTSNDVTLNHNAIDI